MNSLMKYIGVLILLLMSTVSIAVTMNTSVSEQDEQQSNERQVNAVLKARYQNGELHTSHGLIALTPAVQVDDRRAIDDWYKNPAKAKVALIYKGKRLDRVIIY